MSTTKKEQKTRAYYDNHADKWIGNHVGMNAESWVKEYIDQLCKVVPTGIDVSDTFVQIAKTRNLKGAFLQQDVY